MQTPAVRPGSDLAADKAIEREATAATDDETQRQDTPQQWVFVSALSPEQAVGPVDLDYRHRHQADHQSRRYPGDEAQGEQQPAPELDQTGQHRDPRGKPELGSEKLFSAGDAGAAGPAEQLLRTMGAPAAARSLSGPGARRKEIELPSRAQERGRVALRR
jgi:hypothetical protein